MDGQMQSRQRTRSADVLPPPPAPPDDLLRKLKRSMKPPVSFTSWKVRSPKNKLDQRSTPNGQSDLNKAASVPARKDRDAAVEVASQKANLTEPSEGVPQPSSPLASSAIGPAPSTPNLLTDPPRPSLQEEGTSGDCHDLFAQKTSGNTAPAHTDATLLQTEPTTLAAVARRHSNQDAIGLEADVSTVMADLDPPQNLVEKTQNDLDSFPGAMIPSPIHQSIQDNKEGSKLDEPSSKRAISRGKSPLEDFRNSGARSPDQLESQLPLKIGFSPNSTDMFDIESVGPKSPLHTAHQSSQVLQNRGFSDWMKLRTELPDPVPQQANAVYERLVAPFLHSTIKHTAGLRDQLQEKTAYELVMARNSPFSAYVPTIVIRCRNQERQKQIEKALHGKAMASLLQRHPFPTQVVVDPTLGYRLYSLRRKEEELHRNPGFPVELSLSPYTTSICGVRIVVPHDELDGEAIALMTLGGLILANDKPFGLTVAHHMMPMAGGGPSQRTQSVGSGSLRGLSSYEALDDLLDFPLKPGGHVCAAALSVSATYLDAVNVDWALTELEPGLHLPNWIINSDGSHTLVQTIFPQTELDFYTTALDFHTPGRIACKIATASGLIPAFMTAGSAELDLGGSLFKTTRLELPHPLRTGESGSWVIVHGRLCGTIVAARDCPPCAYMIPIEDTFRQISEAFDGAEVKLPGSIDNRMFELRAAKEKALHDRDGRVLELELLRAVQSFLASASSAIPDSNSLLKQLRGSEVHDLTRWSVAPQSLLSDDPRTAQLVKRTGLGAQTLHALLLVGSLCPASKQCREYARRHLRQRKPRLFLSRRASVLDSVKHFLTESEAGENLCVLLFYLSESVDEQEREQLLTTLMRAIDIPSHLVPTPEQLELFLSYFRSTTLWEPRHSLPTPWSQAYEEFPSTRSLVKRYLTREDTERLRKFTPSSAIMMSKLILSMYSLSKANPATILVCTGYLGRVAAIYAEGVLRLPVGPRLPRNMSRLAFNSTDPIDWSPMVYVFPEEPFEICELLHDTPAHSPPKPIANPGIRLNSNLEPGMIREQPAALSGFDTQSTDKKHAFGDKERSEKTDPAAGVSNEAGTVLSSGALNTGPDSRVKEKDEVPSDEVHTPQQFYTDDYAGEEAALERYRDKVKSGNADESVRHILTRLEAREVKREKERMKLEGQTRSKSDATESVREAARVEPDHPVTPKEAAAEPPEAETDNKFTAQ